MPKEYNRRERIASQLQRELAELLQTAIKDPRLGFVTINAVQVSRDLSVAKVYVSALDSGERMEQNLKVLTQASSFLRRELGKRLHIRAIPELRFVRDESVERGARLTAILDALAQEHDKDE